MRSSTDGGIRLYAGRTARGDPAASERFAVSRPLFTMLRCIPRPSAAHQSSLYLYIPTFVLYSMEYFRSLRSVYKHWNTGIAWHLWRNKFYRSLQSGEQTAEGPAQSMYLQRYWTPTHLPEHTNEIAKHEFAAFILVFI